MFLSVLALIFLANCGDDNGGDKPIAAPSLIGKWKWKRSCSKRKRKNPK